MQRLDFKSFRLDAHDCFESVMANILSWYGHRNELISTGVWNFVFRPEDSGEPGILGFRIGEPMMEALDHCRKAMETYNGIVTDIFEKNANLDHDLHQIWSELSAGCPVGLYLDSFWCPWDPGYQKYHGQHLCVITGLDDKTENIICSDPFLASDGLIFPVKEFVNSYMAYITFHPQKESCKTICWQDIIRETVLRLRQDTGTGNAFDAMRRFAVAVGKNIDFEKEWNGFAELWSVPLVSRLKRISNTRLLYARLLSFLGEINSLLELGRLALEVEGAGERWREINNLMSKAFLVRRQSLCEKTAERILNLADFEEKITEELWDFCQGTHQYFKANLPEAPETMEPYSPIRSQTLLDLTAYFNNKGFGVSNDLSSADLTGDGIYFLGDGLPAQSVWKVGEMYFRYPKPMQEFKDNIACEGEIIPIPSFTYTRLMLLGCAEWGHHSAYWEVYDEEGGVEKVLVNLSDAFDSEPVFGETVAWKGMAIVIAEEKIKPVIISAVFNRINRNGRRINRIRLPFCTNMHVFAITLA